MATDPLFLTPCDSWEIYHYWCFFQVSSFFLFLHFLSFFFTLDFHLFFLESSILITFLFNSHKKHICVFFSRSFSFIFFTFHPFFITFCFHLFQHLLQFDPFFIVSLFFWLLFWKLSSLTFFAHIFLSSLSFFLSIVFPFFFFFFLFSLFFFSIPFLHHLLFFVPSFTFIFRKKNMFHSLSLSWCRGLFPPWKRKKTHPESVVKNQIACVVKIVLCVNF